MGNPQWHAVSPTHALYPLYHARRNKYFLNSQRFFDVYVYVIWIQKGFTAEPPRNDSGANFQRNDSDSGPKVRDTGRKSELQTKSRRYSPESEPNRPEKGPEWVFRCFYRKPPLKALLNPPNVFVLNSNSLTKRIFHVFVFVSVTI